MNLAIITLSVGVIVFLSYLFSALFKKFQIPDVFFLIIIGLILGPITNLIDVGQFGILGNLLATFTLIIILFEAGLDLRIREVMTSAPKATLLMFITLIFSILAIVPLGMFIFNLSLVEAIIVGLVVGGISAGIVIPIAEKLPVTEKTKTMLALESNINDIVTISIILAMIGFLNEEVFNYKEFLRFFMIDFIASLSIGIVTAVIWSQIISKVRDIKNNIFMTPALVLATFGITEILGLSGMMAVFAFGITLGNLQYVKHEKILNIFEFKEFYLTSWEKNMFSGFVFLLKTYFFIYIGLSIVINNTLIILAGAIAAILLFVARFLAVKLTISPETPIFDKEILTKLVPKGLVGAALITLVSNQLIQDLTYSIILFSIVFTSILIFLIKNPNDYTEKI